MRKGLASFFKASPIRRVALKFLGLLKDVLTLGDEWRLNIHTFPRPVEMEKWTSSLLKDNEEYATINYWFLRKIIRIVRPSKDDVFYDLGCGMGRVICVLGRRAVKKCVGIEFSPYYFERCRANAARLRGKKSPIEVRCEDASAADVSDGTMYYMFNPFGAHTMDRVVKNIERSLATNPRKIMVIYANPVHRSLLESRPWLHLFRVYRTVGGLDVTFWRSAGCPTG